MVETHGMLAVIHFYHVKDIGKIDSPWMRLRLRVQALMTRHVHCNVEVDGIVFDCGAGGYDVYRKFPYENERVVTRKTRTALLRYLEADGKQLNRKRYFAYLSLLALNGLLEMDGGGLVTLVVPAQFVTAIGGVQQFSYASFKRTAARIYRVDGFEGICRKFGLHCALGYMRVVEGLGRDETRALHKRAAEVMSEADKEQSMARNEQYEYISEELRREFEAQRAAPGERVAECRNPEHEASPTIPAQSSVTASRCALRFARTARSSDLSASAAFHCHSSTSRSTETLTLRLWGAVRGTTGREKTR